MNARLSFIINGGVANGSLSLQRGPIASVRSSLVFPETNEVSDAERDALLEVLQEANATILRVAEQLGQIPTRRWGKL